MANSKRSTGIIFLILGAIGVIAGIVMYLQFGMLKKSCTEYELGTVTQVEQKTVVSTRSGSHEEYKATISFDAGNQFGQSSVTTEWDRVKFTENSKVKVFYDPDDTDKYYVEGMDAGAQGVIFAIVGGVFMLIGLVFVVKK